MFPPPKAEEGLSSQFQQIDRNNGFGYNNGYNGAMGNDETNDEKKKGKKKAAAKNAPAATEGKKNSKPAQFEAPSTSSKQSRANNDEGKKKSQGSKPSKKSKS